MDETIKYIIEESDSEEEKSLAEIVNLLSTFTQLGQYYGILKANVNLLTLLDTKYASTAPENMAYSVIDLKYFRIEFNSEPYLIYDDGANIIKVDNINASKYNNLVAGYIVYVNNQPIIVDGKLNYYELKGDDVSIASVTVPADSDVTIDYVCRIGQYDKSAESEYKKLVYYDTIGQLWGVFKSKASLVTRIKQRYIVKSDHHERQLTTLHGVAIEAKPGTVVYVQDSFDDTVYKHIIGENGVLKLDNENASIEELYFEGDETNDSVTIDKIDAIVDDETEPAVEGVYEDEKEESSSIAAITIDYEDGGSEDIYLTGEEDISARPTSALVDYYCEVMEGDF